MKKILVVIGKLRTGGAEKITLDLITHMDRSGLDVCFLVFGQEIGNYEKAAEEAGCKVIHIDTPKFPYTRYKRQLKRLWIEYGGFDAVHSHLLLNNGVTLHIAKKLGCKKLISHSHSTAPNRKPSIAVRLYERCMKFLIKKDATDFLACGQKAGEYLYGKEFFSRRGVVIANGVEFEKFVFNPEVRARLRKEYHIADDVIIWGHVARLSAVKNHSFLLKIFGDYLSANPKSMLYIVGNGDEEQNIKSLISELKLEKNVIMTGDRNDVYALQNIFDVVVFPSLYEGVPIALIEAQINLLPLVLSDSLSAEVAISENVSYLPLSASENEWTEAVTRAVIKGRGNNKLSEKGYDYDIFKSSAKLLEIYTGRENNV